MSFTYSRNRNRYGKAKTETCLKSFIERLEVVTAAGKLVVNIMNFITFISIVYVPFYFKFSLLGLRRAPILM